MVTSRMLENANKFAYLVKIEKARELKGELEEGEEEQTTLARCINKFGVPAIEINTAIWYATELGFITEPDKTTGNVEIAKEPDAWEFGTTIETLEDMVIYGLVQMAKKEQDFEENYVYNWCLGYAKHDIEIMIAHMLEERRIYDYELTDPDDPASTYLFFTLPENLEMMWGKNAFKPDTFTKGEAATETETPTPDETTTTTTEETTNV